MNADHRNGSDLTAHEFALRNGDHFTAYGVEPERSNLPAFLMGGIVVAGGLLAFLYYDTDRLDPGGNLDLTTGSISRAAPSAGGTVPSIRLAPAAPKDGTER